MVLFTIFSISWSDFVVGIKHLAIFGNCMSLAHRKSTRTLLKMDFKLRNKLTSKCVQFFYTPCSIPRVWRVSSCIHFNVLLAAKTPKSIIPRKWMVSTCIHW
jgi:hypothetical protein